MSNAEHTRSLASPVPTPAHPGQGTGRTSDITETGTTAPSTPQRPYRPDRRRLARDRADRCLAARLVGFRGRCRRAGGHRFGHVGVRARLGDAGRPVGVADRSAPAVGAGASRLTCIWPVTQAFDLGFYGHDHPGPGMAESAPCPLTAAGFCERAGGSRGAQRPCAAPQAPLTRLPGSGSCRAAGGRESPGGARCGSAVQAGGLSVRG